MNAQGLGVAVLLALGACASGQLVGEAPVAMAGQAIAPYEFIERCADLAADDRLDYRFESKAPVHFEIYYREGIAYIASVTRDGVTSDSGIFRAPMAHRYCARWEAGREGALVDFHLRVVRARA